MSLHGGHVRSVWRTASEANSSCVWMRSIWDQYLRVVIGGGAGRGLVSEASSSQSNSRGGDEWPPPEREWWGDRSFMRTNVASRLLVAVSLLGETGGGPYRRYGRKEVLAPWHNYMGETFW